MDSRPSMNYPRDKGSPVLELPLNSEGPADFFPPVCLQSHWDPTSILRRTLPDGYVPQSMDPRPWTRVCMEYTTAGEQVEAPTIDPSIVMPNGGSTYPASKYMEAIDNESKLRALDRPLGTCEGNQWEPTLRSDMYDARALIPDRKGSMSNRIQELAYPRALLRNGPYDCRAENDEYAIQTSSDYMFNNATKQDRYKAMKKPTKPAPPEVPLKAAPETLRPDLLLNAGPPRPVRNVPGITVQGSSNGPTRTMIMQGSAGDTRPTDPTLRVAPGGNGYVLQGGSTPNTYNVNQADLNAMLTRSAETRASAAGIAWGAQPEDPNPERSYERQAANQRDYIQANAVKATMVTTPFSDNSPFAPF